jgi:F0F1-type ATP synthase assembly protein I
MNQKGNQSDQNRGQYAFNLTMAAVAGMVGCSTLIIVLAALILGLLLDKNFNTKPLFTVILMIGSVPVTLVIMFWIVRAATSRIKPGNQANARQGMEDDDRGKTDS